MTNIRYCDYHLLRIKWRYSYKIQKFSQRSKNIEHEFKKTDEHKDRSFCDVTAINFAFKLLFLAAVNKGKLIQIKIQFVRYLLFLYRAKILVILQKMSKLVKFSSNSWSICPWNRKDYIVHLPSLFSSLVK